MRKTLVLTKFCHDLWTSLWLAVTQQCYVILQGFILVEKCKQQQKNTLIKALKIKQSKRKNQADCHLQYRM